MDRVIHTLRDVSLLLGRPTHYEHVLEGMVVD